MPKNAHASSGQSADEMAELAEEVCRYAYPLVLMRVTCDVATNVQEAGDGKAPVNHFCHAAKFPDPASNLVVRPNADTLYSTLFFDVSAEPLVIELPKFDDRYHLFPCLDFWTNVFASPGSRTTGGGPVIFAVTGPEWKGDLPAGVLQYRSPTTFGWIIGRIRASDEEADLLNVRKLQSAIKVHPLSGVIPAPKPVDPGINMVMPPPQQVEEMSSEEFYPLFAEEMKANPPQLIDHPILDRMRGLGFEPGKSLDWASAPVEVREALTNAKEKVLEEIKTLFGKSGTAVNGWRLNLTAVGTYGADYRHRAGVAYAGLGANTIEDAIYPSTSIDKAGNALDSGKRYTVAFPKGSLPPVRGFWSLTLYNKDQLFAENALGRYSINSNNPLPIADDGSLTLYIQREPPAANAMDAWLPTPQEGEFSLTLRLYWPMEEVLNGGWVPPAVKPGLRGK